LEARLGHGPVQPGEGFGAAAGHPTALGQRHVQVDEQIGVADLLQRAAGHPLGLGDVAHPVERIGQPARQHADRGVYSAVGILAALAERERTGRGCLVDTALVDSQVGVLANQALNFLVSGKVPKRIGNAHPNIVPYQVFPVADGHIIIATGNDNQFAKLCAVLGEPKLPEEPRYRANSDRLKHREELIVHLTALTLKWSRDELLAKLEAVQVPAGPINPLDQVFADPQVVHRGMRIDRPSAKAKAGTIPGVRTPIMIGGEPMASERPAPQLGEHNAEILREIGEG